MSNAAGDSINVFSASAEGDIAPIRQIKGPKTLLKNPNDAQGYADLGGGYLEKARETADPSYYTKADQVLQQSMQLGGKDARDS